MPERRVEVAGGEFTQKLLDGERDFSGIRLQAYWGLSSGEVGRSVQEYLAQADLKASPIIFEKADLTGLDADGLSLPHLEAKGAIFKHATMMESNLESSQLANTDFRYARLPQTDMTGCDLRAADLRQADLNLALLKNCMLEGADLAGTNLLFANLQGAKIVGIDHLAQARSVNTANFQFVSLAEKERAVIRSELWAQEGKKRRLFGGAG